MENYDTVLASGTTDLSELEAAAERAYHAADNLAEANGKASAAIILAVNPSKASPVAPVASTTVLSASLNASASS